MIPSRYRRAPSRHCTACGAVIGDCGCSRCARLFRMTSKARLLWPDLPGSERGMTISLAAALQEAYESNHGLPKLTRQQLDDAVDRASVLFKAIKYVLPKELPKERKA